MADLETRTDVDVRYDYKAELVFRGTEARVVAQMQTEGWELVREKPGVLRTQLMFRRPKPTSTGGLLANAWTMLRTRREAQGAALLVGAAVVIGVILGVGAAAEGGGDNWGAGGGSAIATPAADVRTTTAAATASPVAVAAAVEPAAAPKILTRKNNADLAALLKVDDPGDESVAAFAREYAGLTIAFNGNISSVANYDDYAARDCDADVATSCEFLIGAGNYSEETISGPFIKFDGASSVDDLRLVGFNESNTVAMGDEVRIVARVDRAEGDPQMLYLTPISTRLR